LRAARTATPRSAAVRIVRAVVVSIVPIGTI
jgi:hypothetical protein